jgi:glucan phosphoethanolaminetransferase (alkaline phosphatase superfamily)
LRRQSLGLLTMLSIQFILGMLLNLFVDLPKNASFGTTLSHGGIVLALHIIIAVGLLIGSIILIVRSAATRSKSWLIASIIGALGVFVALTNGLAFIFNDDDVTSFIMALGFIVSATTYSTALSFSEKTSTVTKINNSEKVKTLNGRVRHSHS